MTATATLRFTSSRREDNAVRIARVAAAGRIAADRRYREERKAQQDARVLAAATSWVEDLRAAGAVQVGFKICDDWGKHRFRVAVEDAAQVCVSYAVEDVEAWGIRADGEFAGEVW
jgi:hypothetical protein